MTNEERVYLRDLAKRVAGRVPTDIQKSNRHLLSGRVHTLTDWTERRKQVKIGLDNASPHFEPRLTGYGDPLPALSFPRNPPGFCERRSIP